MRTVKITVHNNQELEIFTHALDEGFELWTVGEIKGHRMVLSHYLTHDDLEARLHYARPSDLVWMNAAPTAIPSEKHASAAEEEDSIKRGTFVDNDKRLKYSVSSHFFGVMNLLPLDRKAWNVAKKAILGQWTDNVATVVFEPDAKLKWSCPLDRPHPLNFGARIHRHKPNWWSFASWQLHLMNDEHKCGMRLGVVRVGNDELHVLGDYQDRLVHILRRSR